MKNQEQIDKENVTRLKDAYNLINEVWGDNYNNLTKNDMAALMEANSRIKNILKIRYNKTNLTNL